jgi:hypothetical protein
VGASATAHGGETTGRHYVVTLTFAQSIRPEVTSPEPQITHSDCGFFLSINA